MFNSYIEKKNAKFYHLANLANLAKYNNTYLIYNDP